MSQGQSHRGLSSRAAAEAAARRADEALLARRLELLGLRDVRTVQVHENRTVLVSVATHGVLRVHRGYAYASDRVLQAILTFVNPAARAGARRRAERVLVGFPVDQYVRPSRRGGARGRVPPRDRRLLAELGRMHQRLNRDHFGGRLADIRFRLSNRMRTRLGELVLDERSHQPVEIAISRYHIARDGWEEVEQTLLHEMVHQWQLESGLTVDHGPTFRRKAMEVGVVPGAQRAVRPRRQAAQTRKTGRYRR